MKKIIYSILIGFFFFSGSCPENSIEKTDAEIQQKHAKIQEIEGDIETGHNIVQESDIKPANTKA